MLRPIKCEKIKKKLCNMCSPVHSSCYVMFCCTAYVLQGHSLTMKIYWSSQIWEPTVSLTCLASNAHFIS